MEFVLVFAVVFIVGFVARAVYRVAATSRCPSCRSRIPSSASVCAACARPVAGGRIR